ncbi:hypothetical protein DZB88_11485 [Bacillus sp. OE]|nr:hypothetical protein DZB88_11485 [Bacillus sp. OE]
MQFLFILFTRHTSSPFMLITTYYVRGIRNVWTSYCLSPILTPYLYTRERKTYQQHHSLDAYCSLFKFDRFFSYLFYLLYKKKSESTSAPSLIFTAQSLSSNLA